MSKNQTLRKVHRNQAKAQKRNKKANKPHEPWQSFVVTSAEVNWIQQIFRDIYLISSLKLPTGQCDLGDVRMMRNMMNLATVFAVTSHDNEIAPEDEQKWIDAKRKFGEYYNRVVETKNFTARGEELTAIQQTIDASLDLVKHEFEVQPKFSFWTFNWMKSYLAGARTDESTRVTLNLDKAGIMKRIRAHKLNNRYLYN